MTDSNVFDNEAPNTEPLTIEEAADLLSRCKRFENRDHAFGDREVFWKRGDVEVAGGYFGGGSAEVWIEEAFGGVVFKGNEAKRLAERGASAEIGRNDETGPDNYAGF